MTASLLDDFRTVFPDQAAAPWLKALETWGRGHGYPTTYLESRQLLTTARLRSVRAAVTQARAIVDADTPLTGGPDQTAWVMLVTLTELAELALRSPERADRRLTREIVDAMLVQAPKGQPFGGLARAHAALIHARAGDRTLAIARLEELRDMPTAPVPLEAFQCSLLSLLALSALGETPWAARNDDLMRAVEGNHKVLTGTDRLVANIWLLLSGVGWRLLPGAVAGLPEAITTVAGSAPSDAFWAVTEGIVAFPPGSLDLPDDRATAWSLVAQAEEVTWLVQDADWASAHSVLALCWVRLGYSGEADREMALTLDKLSGGADAAWTQPDDGYRVVANLLDARLGAHSATPTTSPPPAARPAEPSTSQPLLPPEVSSRVAEALSEGIAVLVAGPDLPALAGLPRRSDLMSRLVEEATADGSIAPTTIERLRRELREGDTGLASGVIRDGVGPEARMRLIADAYGGFEGYGQLGSLGFASAVSMGWDSGLVGAFADRQPTVIRADASAEAALRTVQPEDFTFVWLFGDPNGDDVALSRDEARTLLYGQELLARYVAGLAQSYTLVFLGCRPIDVEDFFEVLPQSTAGPPPAKRHVAFVERDELFDLQRTQFERRFGVQLVGLDPQSADALRRVVEALADAADEVRPPAEPRSPVRLTTAVLENIGAFEHLELVLTPGWNLLLGNNGCGKSTVLRAIALGLCGDHPRAVESGQSLLRVGADAGAVELTVGPSVLRTELRRSGGTVRVTTTSLTPLQQGNWAVLGFPALRGFSVSSPQGISQSQSPRPHVNDLLPLLLGGVDRRLDDVKQWIVNIEARKNQPGEHRSASLLRQFFEVLQDLTPGLDLAFDSVDPDTWDVKVRTDGVVVSIDQLSQGISSVLAWVGTLLQRLYDIYAETEEPTRQGAFVLIDELDAHLHPAWQRLLPGLARRHFPEVQFLATTHSPLVAGGLTPQEVFVAMREPVEPTDGGPSSKTTITPSEVDTRGLRADQVLTSPLFGLGTTRDPTVEQEIRRFSHLVGLADRTPEQERDFQRLEQRISGWMLLGETALERQQQLVKEREIESQMAGIGELSPDKATELRNQLDELIPDESESE